MTRDLIRLSGLASLLALIAACGGGSGGGTTGGGGGGGTTPTSTTVTFTFKGATPASVAAKIGSGNFTLQTLSSGALSLSIPSGTTSFAVAYACPTVGTLVNNAFPLASEWVLEATTSDGTAFTPSCKPPWYSGQTGTLTGTVDTSAIPAVTYIEVDALNNEVLLGSPNPPFLGNFSFSAAAGNNRVEVLAYQSPGSPFLLAAARNFDNQAVPGVLNGGSPVVLGASDQTSLQSISYTNVPAGYSAPITDVALDMGYIDPHYNYGGFRVAVQATTQYPMLPATAVESGDFYYFHALTYDSSGNSGGVMSVDKTSTAGGATSFAFPAPWSYAGPTPAVLPTVNLDYAGFSGEKGVTQEAGLDWSAGGVEMYFGVAASASYQNGSSTLTFPDLSGLTGFLAPPASGTQLTWGATVSQSSAGVFQTMPSNGSVNSVSNSGTFSVP